MNLKRINESFKKLYEDSKPFAAIYDGDLKTALMDAMYGLQMKGNNNIKSYEVAFQDVIEKFYPEKSWWDVTDVNIFWSLFEGRNPEATINEIVNSIKVEETLDFDGSLTEDFNTSMLHAINLATERNERFKFDLQSFLTLNDANSIDDLSEEQLTTFYNGIKSIISKTKDNVPEDVLSAFDLTSTDALSEDARPLSKNDIIYRYNFGLPLSDKDIEKIGTVEEHQQNSRNVSEIIKGIKKIIPNCSISKKRDWTSLSLMLRTIEPITEDQQTECKEFLKQFPYPSDIYGADTYLRVNGFITLSPVVSDLSEELTEDAKEEYFGGDLDKVKEDNLVAWISEHDQLYSDYKNYFKVDESLTEDLTPIIDELKVALDAKGLVLNTDECSLEDAAEYIEISREALGEYTVEDWIKDTQDNYPETFTESINESVDKYFKVTYDSNGVWSAVMVKANSEDEAKETYMQIKGQKYPKVAGVVPMSEWEVKDYTKRGMSCLN